MCIDTVSLPNVSRYGDISIYRCISSVCVCVCVCVCLCVLLSSAVYLVTTLLEMLGSVQVVRLVNDVGEQTVCNL